MLLVGIGAGYFITNNLYFDYLNKKGADNAERLTSSKVNAQEEKENKVDKSSTTVSTLEEGKENKVDSNLAQTTPEYDGSKSITVNGKKYTISYLSEKYNQNEDSDIKQTEIKMFLNNKKIKTINMEWIDNVNHIYGKNDYDVELHNICKDYILVVVKAKKDDGMSEPVNKVQFCIFNTEGEHIDTLKWNDYTQISVKNTGERLTYSISDDFITIQENCITKKYSVVRDWMKEEIVKIYQEDELNMSGK